MNKSFKDSKQFREWLMKNHEKSDGIWVQIFKKDSGKKSISYNEVVEEVLCFGWIDGQRKSYDEESFIQKVTPRRSKSIWSKRNTEFVAKLIEEKRMTPNGLKAIEEAKADGRWDNAYASQKHMEFPEEFLSELKKSKKAEKKFLTLSKSELYHIYFQISSAKKPETKIKRIKNFITKLQA